MKSVSCLLVLLALATPPASAEAPSIPSRLQPSIPPITIPPRATRAYPSLQSAITACHTITFTYHGTNRTVHPHRLGISAKGKTLLRAWEVQKGAESCGRWKLYDLSKLTALTVSSEPFIPRPDHRHDGDSAMPGGILAEVPLTKWAIVGSPSGR